MAAKEKAHLALKDASVCLNTFRAKGIEDLDLTPFTDQRCIVHRIKCVCIRPKMHICVMATPYTYKYSLTVRLFMGVSLLGLLHSGDIRLPICE